MISPLQSAGYLVQSRLGFAFCLGHKRSSVLRTPYSKMRRPGGVLSTSTPYCLVSPCVENPLHHWQFGCGTSEVLLTIMAQQKWAKKGHEPKRAAEEGESEAEFERKRSKTQKQGVANQASDPA